MENIDPWNANYSCPSTYQASGEGSLAPVALEGLNSHLEEPFVLSAKASQLEDMGLTTAWQIRLNHSDLR